MTLVTKHSLKYLIWTFLFIFHVQYLTARIIIEENTPFRISAAIVGNAGIAPGEIHSTRSPLVHMQNGLWNDLYWLITQEREGLYSIRNAETEQYISFTAIKTRTILNIQLTDSLAGDSSLWRFDEQSSGFVIRSAVDTLRQLYVNQNTFYVAAQKFSKLTISNRTIFTLYSHNGLPLIDETERQLNILNYFDSLTFNGIKPIYDKVNNLLMLTVSPEKLNDRRYTPIVEYHHPRGLSLYINNRRVPSGNTFAMGNVTGGKTYTLLIKTDTGTVSSTKMTLTLMPIVEITGYNFQRNSFINGTFRITDADFPQNNDSLYIAAFRIRGNSTAGKDKKSYAVKLYDKKGSSMDRRLHGLRNDNYWVMDAMSIDLARMRNPISMQLWSDFSRPLYYMDREPNARKAARCFFAEVYLNGKYIGIYNIMERNDRKQFNLKKSQVNDSEEVVRGLIYKGDQWGHGIQMNYTSQPPSYDNNNDLWEGWELKYPDLEKSQKIDWSVLYNAVSFVSLQKSKYFNDHVAEYFDLPVLIDYYLLLELSQGYDDMGKNIHYLVYNMQEDKKMTIAPWDFDGAWGRDWNSLINPREDPEYEINQTMFALNNLYRKLVYFYPQFVSIMGERYKELRRTYFSDNSLRARFMDNFNLFNWSGADTREEHCWSGHNGMTLNFKDERTYLYDWIGQRTAFLDKKYGYDPATGISTVSSPDFISVVSYGHGITIRTTKSQLVHIYDATGHLILTKQADEGTTHIPLPPGIYIVNHQKLLIR